MSIILRILLCVTVLIFVCNSFVFGGQMRTYVGTNDTIEEEQSSSEEGEIDKISPPESTVPIDPREEKETAVTVDRQDRTEHIRPMVPEPPIPRNSIENNIIQENEGLGEGSGDDTKVSNETQQVPERIPEDQVKPISHEHIKLGGGYKMKGEPDNK